MSGNHEHADVKALPESRLLIAFGLTSLFMLVEFIGGYLTGSLALISDAMHMMTDAFALLLALIAIHAGRKAADVFRTYGYARFEILAATMNALILMAVAFYILYEAYKRLSSPPDIQSIDMLIIALIGFVVNLISMKLLTSTKDESLNVKGAYLEVWADMLGSIGVIIGAVIIWLTGWEFVDSIIAVLIGFMVFPRTWILLKECLNILLEGVPRGVDLIQVTETINNTPDVVSSHDLHLWALTQSKLILSGHIVYQPNADHEELRIRLEQQLREQFRINHITLQMECEDRQHLEKNHH
ncbi:cation diffusion facilitator family transporter [Proteus sp. G2639]|uniref:cation diffusion facilitator family transporter n=1 Tax=Proteus vulgaris TaxID=585 RepID=UPI001376BE94|nr:cation diffusion facilitator family transporter [Proteus vulgaris]NBN59922.1 cation diffusion facilitator family transporter [Proteus sp. G2639]UWT99960.1 cation diffusion facilitator family transporter [Proteus vulgaris]